MGDPILNLCEEMYKGKCVPLKKPQNIAGISRVMNSWYIVTATKNQMQLLLPSLTGYNFGEICALRRECQRDTAPPKNEKTKAYIRKTT